MSWSIQQVARLSGVTARTLRHYDDIGLLRPARVGANGYRYYEQAELLRLQEILLLRELGVDLPTIAAVLDGAAIGSTRCVAITAASSSREPGWTGSSTPSRPPSPIWKGEQTCPPRNSLPASASRGRCSPIWRCG